jgi:hypothetical protein
VDEGLQAQRVRAEALAMATRAQSSIQASNRQIARARALIAESNRLILCQPMDPRGRSGAEGLTDPDM